MKQKIFSLLLVMAVLVAIEPFARAQSGAIGIFDEQGDVGVVKHKGTGSWD